MGQFLDIENDAAHSDNSISLTGESTMPKRTTLYPCVRPRGKSLQVDFTLATGERRLETIKVKPTKENQLIWYGKLSVISEQIAADTFDYKKWFPRSKWLKKKKVKPSEKTLESAMTKWLERIRPEIKPGSADSYQTGINMMSLYLGGDTLLSDLDFDMIDDYIIKRRQEGTATKTLRNQFTPFRSAVQKEKSLSFELKMSLLVATQLRKTRAEKTKASEIYPFDLDEIILLIKKEKLHQYRNLLEFYLGSGVRSGEAFALCWEDVDHNKRGVNILRSLSSGEYTTPKHDSMRFLPLGNMAWEAIIAQEAHTKMLPPISMGDFGEKRPVFMNPKSKKKTKQWTSAKSLTWHFWKPLMKKAGIPERYQYQTRHTFASLALMYGKHPIWIADHMGHKDTAMITKSYGKYLEKAYEQKDHPVMKRIFDGAGTAKRLDFAA
jgi:integrase